MIKLSTYRFIGNQTSPMTQDQVTIDILLTNTDPESVIFESDEENNRNKDEAMEKYDEVSDKSEDNDIIIDMELQVISRCYT